MIEYFHNEIQWQYKQMESQTILYSTQWYSISEKKFAISRLRTDVEKS